MLAVTSFGCTNSVFNETEGNNNFSIRISGLWRIPIFLEDTVPDKLKKLLKLRSQKDIEVHVEEVRKRGNQIEIGDREYKLSDLDTSKIEKPEEI